MQILAGLLTTWLPTQTAPIAVQEADGSVQATVRTIGQIQSRRLKNEAGQTDDDAECWVCGGLTI